MNYYITARTRDRVYYVAGPYRDANAARRRMSAAMWSDEGRDVRRNEVAELVWGVEGCHETIETMGGKL